MIFSRDLQHIYLKLAQKLRQAYEQLSLKRLQAITRYGLLQLILVHLLQISHGDAHAILLSFAPDEQDLSLLVPLLADCDALLPDDCFAVDSLTYLISDLIGRVYEQSLAYHLVEHGQGLELHIDQSLRQREGSYYTPAPVVRFLVERTVGRVVQSIKDEVETLLLEGHYQAAQVAIDRLKTIKVLDMTCGSGIFLLAACDVLTRAYCWWNERLQVLANEHISFFLETRLYKEPFPVQTILQHCIFGIDRDPQAVAIARLNLSLYWNMVGAQFIAPASSASHKHKGAMNCAPTTFQYNIVIADALYPSPDIDALLGTEPQQRIILGNPPWGADMSFYKKECLSGFALARGQYDSYELCIERATQCLRQGDLLGYVVPDSILQPPEHARLRAHILRYYNMQAIVKLGEGVFEDVFRGSVAFIFARNEDTENDHTVRCHIVVKDEREFIFKNPRENTIQKLLDKDGISISQTRFVHNKDKVFDIFTSDADELIITSIKENVLNWRDVLTTGRGVEISKTGAVMACPFCGIWQNIPHKQKNGGYLSVKCANHECGHTITYDKCPHATIIASKPTLLCMQPIIVGESVNRYQVVGNRYLDTSKVKNIPKCPMPDPNHPRRNCGYADTASYPFIPGEIRICKRCKQTYTEANVKEWLRLGINYKSSDLYTGEKLLVRKTGRGIYATIDKTGAYTNQVVFIFKLKQDRPVDQQHLRLSYILGVLNSRMMLYYYYKSLGDIEWKSFPYMTQDTIMGLPIRKIDFKDARQCYLYDKIADLVDSVLASKTPPDSSADNEIERHVRILYGVENPAASARIDAELEHIRSFGSLLGSRDIDVDS